MSNAPGPPAPKPLRVSPGLVGGGVLVVALGFGLPALFSSYQPPAERPNPLPAAREPVPADPPSAASIGTSLLKLVAGLALMCGACVLAAKFVAPKPPAANGPLEALAALPVGACVVHLVRAGERRLLVGTDASGVKAVLELPGSAPEPPPSAEPAAAEPAVAPAAAPPTHAEIVQLLLSLRARAGNPGAPAPG